MWVCIHVLALCALPLLSETVRAQMIGSPPPAQTAQEEQSDKVLQFVSRLAERLTTQEMGTKKISCDERVTVEELRDKGKPGAPLTRSYVMNGEMKQQGTFSIDLSFIEEHKPVESRETSGDPNPVGGSIDASLLVRDSFSAAAEFLGMSHREIYSQRLLGKEKLDDREAFVIAFQTLKQMEGRQITVENRSVPMKVTGKVWLDASSGMLLRIEVKQVKLPKGVREFSYDIRYTAVPGPRFAFLLPAAVHFVRIRGDEKTVTTQTFSNYRVN